MTVPPVWGGEGGSGGAGSGGGGEADASRMSRALAKRCRHLAHHNQTLIHRIYQVKRMTKRYRREIKFLMARLDKHGDDFRSVKTEEDVKPNVAALQGVVKTERNPSSRSLPNDRSFPAKRTPSKKKSRSEKIDKDLGSLKKPNSSYFQFNQEHRPLVIAESNTDLSFGETSKQERPRPLVSKWKTFSNEEKLNKNPIN